MLLNAFLLIGAFQGIFISSLLIFKKKLILAERVLASWLTLISSHLLYTYLSRTGTFTSDSISVLSNTVPFFQAPMMYLYFSVLFLGTVNTWKISIHFLPAIFALIYQFSSTEYLWLTFIFKWYMMISVPIYIIWIFLSWRIISRNEENIHQASNWLKWPLIGLCIIWITLLGLELLANLDIVHPSSYFFLSVTAFIYFIAFHLYKNGSWIEFTKITHNGVRLKTLESAVKYSRSGLTNSQAVEIQKELLKYMNDEKPFLDADLNLKLLASYLNVRANHLSQVLNELEKKGFNDFVNSYRLKEFMYLISTASDKNITFLSLAFKCGFSSKSSFNRIFKKEYHSSPREYIQHLNKN